jgi:hypothetical protein
MEKRYRSNYYIFHNVVFWCTRHPQLENSRKIILEERIHFMTLHDRAKALAGEDPE